MLAVTHDGGEHVSLVATVLVSTAAIIVVEFGPLPELPEAGPVDAHVHKGLEFSSWGELGAWLESQYSHLAREDETLVFLQGSHSG